MTTKGLSRKQFIILINRDNTVKFIKKSSQHISNINKALRNVKSDILVDFICLDQLGIIVITCKIASSDLQIIKNYIENIKYINAMSVNVPHLLQSKSYLKIIGILYFSHDDLSKRLLSKDVEEIIKQN